VLGVSVSRPVPEIETKVRRLATRCAALLGAPPPSTDAARFVDARGPGFGIASEAGRAAARLALETEGLLLDATYTAKSFAALLDDLPGGPVVFWHTGGLVTAIGEYITEGAIREPANT
jgi:1-aminocyclopropane-1-carboxylate deaminase/D-cysteine desulfhydrase-like pyridoxal-dependent ACC family enzyme